MITFLKRKRVRPAEVAVDPTPGGGRLPCRERGCTSQEGLLCAYVDRRMRSCDTAWCPEHVTPIGGRPFCRRHAGIMRALPGIATDQLPDIDNRAPSLVDWVAAEVVVDVETALREMADSGQHVQAAPAHLALLAAGNDRVRAWERSWKLYDHVGIHQWVALDVDEDKQLEIAIRVNAKTVARLVPPWIEARNSGRPLTPEADAAQRRAFTAEIVRIVRMHLGLPAA